MEQTLLGDERVTRLPHEVETGNVEYKLKLDPSPERFEHLVTQLKWRLAEGAGEAVFLLGVSDVGQLLGLARPERDRSLATLQRMAAAVGATASVARERTVGAARTVVEVRLRKAGEAERLVEVRVAILGATGSGKSSFLGLLAHGVRDNGRGRARLGLLRHRHELTTGQTSSISHQVLGFRPGGEVVNFASDDVTSWEQICELSSKIITFLDTCGDKKYLKTTVSGLTGRAPDYACVVIDGSAGSLDDMAREHVLVAATLALPMFSVVTKIDASTPSVLQATLRDFFALLKSAGVDRVPFVVQTRENVASAAARLLKSAIVPIFLSSSVTGEHTDLIYSFLNLLSQRTPRGISNGAAAQPLEIQIDERVRVDAALGTIVSGMVRSGVLVLSPIDATGKEDAGSAVAVGPDARGRFHRAWIVGIHRQRVPVRVAECGEFATFALAGAATPPPRRVLAAHSTETLEKDAVRRMAKRERRQLRFASQMPACGSAPADRSACEQGVGENAGSFFWATGGAAEPLAAAAPRFTPRRGMVILDLLHPSLERAGNGLLSSQTARLCTAQVTVVHHNGRLQVGSVGMLHVGSVRQRATVVSVSGSIPETPADDASLLNSLPSSSPGPLRRPLRRPSRRSARLARAKLAGVLAPGTSGRVTFRFSHEDEWLRPGWAVLFHGDGVKAVGVLV